MLVKPHLDDKIKLTHMNTNLHTHTIRHIIEITHVSCTYLISCNKSPTSAAISLPTAYAKKNINEVKSYLHETNTSIQKINFP